MNYDDIETSVQHSQTLGFVALLTNDLTEEIDDDIEFKQWIATTLVETALSVDGGELKFSTSEAKAHCLGLMSLALYLLTDGEPMAVEVFKAN